MRAKEFVNPALEEGWKQNVAALGAAGALAFGGWMSQKNSTQPVIQTTQATQATQNPLNLPEPALILTKVAQSSGIVGTELAQLLAQVSHETMNFQYLKELGKSSYFRKYDIKHNPRLAKILGNVNPGDGEKFKGRGFLQITGRANYKKLGEIMNLPLEENPELLEDPKIAAKASIVYWQKRVQPHVSDFTDTRSVTRKINSGLKGLQDRINRFTDYESKIQGN